jgi:hypothetical protein
MTSKKHSLYAAAPLLVPIIKRALQTTFSVFLDIFYPPNLSLF